MHVLGAHGNPESCVIALAPLGGRVSDSPICSLLNPFLTDSGIDQAIGFRRGSFAIQLCLQ